MYRRRSSSENVKAIKAYEGVEICRELVFFKCSDSLNLGASNGSVPILELQITPDNSNLQHVQTSVMGSSSHWVMRTNDRKLGNKTVRVSISIISEKD